MKWFRLYDEVIDDPKVQDLRPELFKFWINLMCLANRQKERGTVPSAAHVATGLGMRRDHVDRFIGALEAHKLLIRGALGVLRIHAWDTRQPVSDNVALRVSAYRAKVSAKIELSQHIDKKRYTEGPCNVTVTAPDSDSDVSLNEKQKTPLRPPTGGEQQDRSRPDQCTCKSDRPPKSKRESPADRQANHLNGVLTELNRRNDAKPQPEADHGAS